MDIAAGERKTFAVEIEVLICIVSNKKNTYKNHQPGSIQVLLVYIVRNTSKFELKNNFVNK